MKVKDLIKALERCPQSADIKVADTLWSYDIEEVQIIRQGENKVVHMTLSHKTDDEDEWNDR